MKILRILRIIIALAVFVLISAQFLDAYHKLPKPYFMYNPTATQFAPSLLKMLATGSVVAGAAFVTFTVFALIFGRAYCSFFCPFGILMDIFRRIGKPLRPKKGMRFAPAHNYIRAAFLALAVAAIAFGYTALLGIIDPYSLYGKIMGSVFHPTIGLSIDELGDILYSFGAYAVSPVDGDSSVALSAFGFALFILFAIAIVSAIRGRLYCNTVCPVGAFLGFLSKFSLFKLGFSPEKCVSCGLCERNCKTQCMDSKKKTLDFSRCVLCFDCASKCPKNAIKIVPNDFLRRKIRADKASAGPNAPKPASVNAQKSFSASRRAFPALAVGIGALFSSAAKSDAQAAKRMRLRKNGSGEKCGAENDVPSPYGLKGERADKRLCVPAGSKSVENFLEHCTACQACVAACKSQVLKPSAGEWGLSGFMQPFMDYSSGFCLYTCHSCTKVCPTGAIDFLTNPQKQKVKIGTAVFQKDLCVVNTDGTDCAACAEHCPVQAIEMVPFGKKENSLYIPFVHSNVCIGCGACEFVCPVRPHRAIVVRGLAEHRQAKKFNESMRKFIPEKTDSPALKSDEFPF